jgi:hypothetical protein
MKISNRVAFATAIALVATVPAAASHSWGNYHWARKSNPFALRINGALSSKWIPHAKTAMTDWAKSTVLNFTSTAPIVSGAGAKLCNPIAGQILVCNALYGQRGWLGIASIWANGDHITQATTKLNDTYFNMARYNTLAWRQLVACQEIGHDFGLAHQDENFYNANLGTCMDYTNVPGTNQHPNQHDYDQLVKIYSHTDSFNSFNSTAAATNFGIREVGKPAGASGDRGVGDTMADWGRAIHHDGNGRPDMFIRQLADGRTVISHVFWAPDAKGTEAS